MNGILWRVEDFAKRLVEREAQSGTPDELSKDHFSVDLTIVDEQIKAEREHNVAVSSGSPTGWHLTTGHIFHMADAYWVCVSPACDMVPAQLSEHRTRVFGERLPFLAIKLREIGNAGRRRDVQSNRYVFVAIDGVVKCFCVNEPEGESSSPEWHTLYADKRGEFTKNFGLKIHCAEAATRGMKQRRLDAVVVAQLRSEYALNLVQRLSGNFTRVGLDYV